MDVKHCIMDLKDYVEGLRARANRNAREMRTEAGEAGSKEWTRFETSQWMTLDFMNELERIAACWEEGFPARQSTQVALSKEG